MKIPAFDLESRVLLVAAAAVLVAVLRWVHLVRFSDSGEIGLLFFFAILLANFVVSSRHAAAATALSFLCFELLCWMNPPARNSMLAAIFHGFLLALFGLCFALYAFAAILRLFRPRSKAEPVRIAPRPPKNLPVRELSGAAVEGGQ